MLLFMELYTFGTLDTTLLSELFSPSFYAQKLDIGPFKMCSQMGTRTVKGFFFGKSSEAKANFIRDLLNQDIHMP